MMLVIVKMFGMMSVGVIIGHDRVCRRRVGVAAVTLYTMSAFLVVCRLGSSRTMSQITTIRKRSTNPISTSQSMSESILSIYLCSISIS